MFSATRAGSLGQPLEQGGRMPGQLVLGQDEAQPACSRSGRLGGPRALTQRGQASAASKPIK